MDTVEIVERVMTQHWDMAACPCWICKNGRKNGCRPRPQYRHSKKENGIVFVPFLPCVCNLRINLMKISRGD